MWWSLCHDAADGRNGKRDGGRGQICVKHRRETGAVGRFEEGDERRHLALGDRTGVKDVKVDSDAAAPPTCCFIICDDNVGRRHRHLCGDGALELCLCSIVKLPEKSGLKVEG